MSHLHHKVSALIDGELSANARTRALAHARCCDECRREIAETLEIKRRLNRLAPAEVSADLLDVMGSMPHAAGPQASTSPGPWATVTRRVLVGMGSVSAVVVAIAYVVGAPEPSQARVVRPPVEEFAADFADGAGAAPLADPPVAGLDTEPAADVPSTSAGRVGWKRFGGIGSAGPDAAKQQVGSGRRDASPRAALELQQAIAAPERTSFRGTQVVRTFGGDGERVFRLAVAHVPGQGTEYAILGADGRRRSEAFVGQPGASVGQLDDASTKALLSAYDLAVAGTAVVDHRPCTVLVATQHGRTQARFWIDNETGLLLRRALYLDGHLVRWTSYQTITTADGQRPFMLHLAPEPQRLPGHRLSMTVAPALNDKGWTCPTWLDGDFRLTVLHQVADGGAVMHAEYTDGISTISVFEQRGRLSTAGLAGFHAMTVDSHPVYVKDGLPMTAVWESGGTVFTMVTDVPAQEASTLLARLPHASLPAPDDDGMTARIGNGLSRMADALPG